MVSAPLALDPLVGEKGETDCQNADFRAQPPDLLNWSVWGKLVSAFLTSFPGDAAAL